jgi:hypothetical protein
MPLINTGHRYSIGTGSTYMDHKKTPTLPTSAPPPHGISDDERPPRPSQPLTAKPHHRAFVVPTPRLAEGAPIPDQHTASPGSSLMRWFIIATWCLTNSPNCLLAPISLPPSPRSCLHMACCPAKTRSTSHLLSAVFFLCGTLMALSPQLPPRLLHVPHRGSASWSSPPSVAFDLLQVGPPSLTATEPSANDVLRRRMGHLEEQFNASTRL